MYFLILAFDHRAIVVPKMHIVHWGNPESFGINVDQAKTHLTQLLRELATTLHLVNKTLFVALWSSLASAMLGELCPARLSLSSRQG